MNKLFFVVLAMLCTWQGFAQKPLTDSEREKAIAHLSASQADLKKAVKGLKPDQLNWKPSEEAWSIAECVEHLAISENALFEIVEGTLENDPDPEKRAEVKMSDDQLLGFIEDRSTKVKTQAAFEPSNKFDSFKGSLKAFMESRNDHLNYLRTSADDLRNRYFEFPFGKVDSYQIILFISGHTNRHIQQIQEIKENQHFPA